MTQNVDWQALCLHWQGVLHLQDWEIKVLVVRRDRLANPSWQGQCSTCVPNRQAEIRLLDPIDYGEDNMFPQDMERTLVHELLHCHFAPIDITDDKSIVEEQAIEALAKSFIKLHRAGGQYGTQDDSQEQTVST